MVKLFLDGGPFMWPILGLFIIGLVIVFERVYALTTITAKTKAFTKSIKNILLEDGISSALAACQESTSPVAAMYSEALRHYDKGFEKVEKTLDTIGALEMTFLEKNQIWLSTVIVLAPMMGFTGTVSGMVNAFQDIAAANDMSPAVVASGISEALLTTLFGLIVAMIIQIFQNFFLFQIDNLVIDMERSSLSLMDDLENKEIKK
ncbi:MAG: MotA/TolQ/ExbB proton channel family protein [Candidatus Marinimicrobia bacterium]|jgi:biopolymer transport protein ExbB|nr:MotA/TolQ/ExbB proton channel family protein [Candidatus Neomarinimicrobiota bacterium]MDD4960654.1 MotA/TolQ/ExbB proton channel family protein [Candidatus Neomarinimicrobiota bacterium]MDX9777543.1 MotA/TolQ/ExbB proton channel family protein [bacterium]